MQISIITASYNYEEYIKETIESVIAQTYTNWEMVIVDDGSRDNSVEVIKSYCAKDSRIKLYQHENGENKGLIETVKLGIEKAQNEWIVFLESDDTITPDYLETKLGIIKQYPDVKFIFNDVNLFGDAEHIKAHRNHCMVSETILKDKSYPINLLSYMEEQNVISTFSVVMLNKNILKKVKFNVASPSLLDWYLWTQLAVDNDFYYIDKKLTNWRVHSNSYISVKRSPLEMCLINIQLRNIIHQNKSIFVRFFNNFNSLRKCLWRMYLKKCLDKIFSIKKSPDKKHKIFVLFGVKLKFRQKVNLIKLRNKYHKIEQSLQEKYKKDRINVTFLVSIAAMFPAKPFMRFLLSQNKYNVKVLIVPDLRFGEANIKKLQNECYEQLKSEFGENILIKAPIDNDNDNVDIKSFTDIMFMSLPYDVSYYKYSLENIINLNILPCCVNYAFYRAKYERIKLISKLVYSLYWKVFTETKYNHDEFENYCKNKTKHCALVGYCKMDDFKDYENMKSDKKTILIAPHHSVEGGFNDILALSNFNKYSDLFLKLPDMYPDIDFIFRPHPALFLCLEKEEFWGKSKVDSYISEMKNKKNVVYDDNGNYFETFAKSDGIIQDCGSYLVEYFYTEKPQCYMLKSEDDIENKFVKLGKKCLEHCYIAYDEKAIIDFIDNVIIKGDDPKQDARIEFARNEVKRNYPFVSQKIFEHFEQIFRSE